MIRKYRNIPTVVDGISFDSKAEARRYGELKLLQRAGEIAGLELQPKFVLSINGIKICKYIGDFAYCVVNGGRVVEDVKSPATRANRVYQLKKRLLRACEGIEIKEVA